MAPAGASGAAAIIAARHFLNRFSKPARILVGVSGGSDSLGLLLALHEAAAATEHRVSAATVDHGLRRESAGEAEEVARLCAARGIGHHILQWRGDKPATGISAAARLARYRLLGEAARLFSADCVAIAHTADDQAETVTMRAARGAGPGLAGMAGAVLYDRSVWIARPFLALDRQTIRDFLTSGGVEWIDDPSNTDPHYERVRVRMALAAGAVAGPNGEDAAETRSRLARQAALWLDAHATLAGGALVRVASEGLSTPADVLRFGLGGLVAMLGGRESAPGGAALARLLAMVSAGQPARTTLGRVFVALRRDGLYLMREARDLPDLTVPPGGEAVWDGRFVISNPQDAPLPVMPANTGFPGAGACDLPPSLIRRAVVTLPHFVASQPCRIPSVLPRIAPYDLFLPGFDLSFANSLARLAGRETFTLPPFTL